MWRCYICNASAWNESIKKIEVETKHGKFGVGACAICCKAIKKNKHLRRKIIYNLEARYEKEKTAHS